MEVFLPCCSGASFVDNVVSLAFCCNSNCCLYLIDSNVSKMKFILDINVCKFVHMKREFSDFMQSVYLIAGCLAVEEPHETVITSQIQLPDHVQLLR